MKLKTNEQITKAFDIEEAEKLRLLRKRIIDCNEKLKTLQKDHKLITGKKYFYLLAKGGKHIL